MKKFSLFIVFIITTTVCGCNAVDQRNFKIIKFNGLKYIDFSKKNLINLLNLNEKQLSNLLEDLAMHGLIDDENPMQSKLLF